MKQFLSLIPSIKRRIARMNDARAQAADAALKAKRPAVLARGKMTCLGCRYQAVIAAHLDVHHLDDDHSNNADPNLGLACHLCHPYQHVGEVARRNEVWAEGVGKKTILAEVPELSAADLNLLQRAIGAALLDESTREEARAINALLLDRADITKVRFGTYHATDFAAGMAALTEEQYADRARVLADSRVLFSEALLARVGKEFLSDYPSRPVASWPHIAGDALSTGAGRGPIQAAGALVAAVGQGVH